MHKNFHETMAIKHKVPDGYLKLCFTHNKTNIYHLKKENLIANNTVLNVSLFPSYIEPQFSNSNAIDVVKIPQKKIIGYAVLIKNHPDLETLFKVEYKKNFRANILRFVNRFESCFNANYKLFYGDIMKEEYLFLMNTLHNMLTARFHQRNDSNKVLANWNSYLDSTNDLIKEKKASLFVIYNNTTPVHICLNHHFNNILFVSVPSYDINYSKFALGNVSLYKLLEWSVNNRYQIMDMAQGYLEYKRRWSNLIYDFEHHIIYPNKNTINKFLAKIEIQKLHFKNYLKSKNIDDLVENIKKRLKKNATYTEDLLYEFDTVELSNSNATTNITINSHTFNKIIKPINDFLYTHKEHLDDLKVFELIKEKEYILQGKGMIQKLYLK
ncbi:acetyltransferase (GNAT) family protein [Mariniflexile fucanivorans]|uniref:Acetyltransferase (GNAT) family protein n=1 Tax=Mariniflexile fucanivorans TaxID=264023 RepID=A0A4R1RGD2_9FLAO|nr:GNAT family N-acetyltransferase [Mariniflexile fucanivorans]TCL65031.1 acetyltransferase (GNAT) family protein [Mariniflexile fucanivorans]